MLHFVKDKPGWMMYRCDAPVPSAPNGVCQNYALADWTPLFFGPKPIVVGWLRGHPVFEVPPVTAVERPEGWTVRTDPDRREWTACPQHRAP